MAEISVSLIRELREKTGAGMMDCKKALVAGSGDLKKAIEFLRKSGIAKAAKKSGRQTTEGKIISKISGNCGAMVEILCETDFVAKNEQFTEYCSRVCDSAIADFSETDDITTLIQEKEKDVLVELISKIGENIQIRRAIRWQTQGAIATYLHMGGKIGVLVEANGDDNTDFLSDICMHVAAFSPSYLAPDDVPQEVIEKEKEIAAAQPELVGKPEAIMGKIIHGKLNKWFNENCLAKQPWIRDDKIRVEQVSPRGQVTPVRSLASRRVNTS